MVENYGAALVVIVLLTLKMAVKAHRGRLEIVQVLLNAKFGRLEVLKSNSLVDFLLGRCQLGRGFDLVGLFFIKASSSVILLSHTLVFSDLLLWEHLTLTASSHLCDVIPVAIDVNFRRRLDNK